MSIGTQIKAARNRAGLTQKELAAKAGVAAITIQQYERDVREPKLEQLQRIADALDVHILSLIGIPASKEYSVAYNADISIETVADNIHKRFNVPLDTAKNIADYCFQVFQRSGSHKENISMGQLYDSLDEVGKKSALDYLKFLAKGAT